MPHRRPGFHRTRTRAICTARCLLSLAFAALLSGTVPIGTVLIGTVLADDEAMSRPAVRTDSLELPGLTAGCHVCEWRPKLNQRPASTECGIDDAGKPRTGLFECGYSPDCERICNFLSCAER